MKYANGKINGAISSAFSVLVWSVLSACSEHITTSFDPARARSAWACALRALGLLLYSRKGEDFLTGQPDFFYGNCCNSGTESWKIVPKVGNEWSLWGLQTVHWRKLGSYGKNWIFRPKTEIFGQKKHSLLNFNNVLATTEKSCSKKKSAFAQIIKGGNVILGDFLE